MKTLNWSFILLLFFSGLKLNTFADPAQKNTLRLLTINVWSGLDYKGNLKMGEYESETVRKKRYHALVAQIKELDPDVIGIQEANKLPDYAERLAEDIGYKPFYHVGVGGVRLGAFGLPWNLREGDAILVKDPLEPEFAGRRQLSGGYVGNWATFHFSDATQVIAVKVKIQESPVYIFVTHWHASLLGSPKILKAARDYLKNGEANRKEYEQALAKIEEGEQWRLLESEKTLTFIKEIAGNHPFVLMGDFNAKSSSFEIKNLLQAGMVDLFRAANPDSSGFTWDPQSNLNQKKYYFSGERSGTNLYEKLLDLHETTPKRIDYIFAGPASSITSAAIKINTCHLAMHQIIDGVHVSDHYGVFAEIEFL